MHFLCLNLEAEWESDFPHSKQTKKLDRFFGQIGKGWLNLMMSGKRDSSMWKPISVLLLEVISDSNLTCALQPGQLY